jgi:signal transduction histidine kinase
MPTVLHIEDDASNRRLVRKVLTGAGFDVVEAADGISGIREAMSCNPDLILLDIELPDMDGYEVTLKLRGELSDHSIPIVALSGKGDRDMSIAVGCDGHIFKPFDVGRLPGQVRTFIKGAREAADPDTGRLLLAQGHKLASRLQTKIEELERTNRALLQSEKVRADFYRNLSHELSTPLTPAVGYINMLQTEELGPLTPLQRRAIQSIGRGVNKVRSVVENLLDMTALTTGKMEFFTRRYDFNQQARESITLCTGLLDDRGVALETSIHDASFDGFGDPDKLKRAMVQLIENAVKFCQGGGKVHVATRRSGGQLTFLVYDSGKGIPENELDAVFKTFYQVDGSPTREHGGAGIGLALARKIVERFGGEIWAESPPRGEPKRLSWARTLVAFRVPEVMDGEKKPGRER